MHIKQTLILLALVGTAPLMNGIAGCSQSSSPKTDLGFSVDTAHTMPAMSHDMAEMDLGPKDENFDLRFLDAMILHHQGAIDMARIALENSSRPEIKTLAQAIIEAQQKEITQMQQWRQAWYPQVENTPMVYHPEMGHMMPMPEEIQFAMKMDVDLGKADEAFDGRFLDAMIPHHEGALVMAQQVLERSERPELQTLAQAILTSQQQEIEQMKQWKETWY